MALQVETRFVISPPPTPHPSSAFAGRLVHVNETKIDEYIKFYLFFVSVVL
jgi:hypothetical protein